jgi:hypothetical protein
MNVWNMGRGLIVWVACLGLLSPRFVFGGPPVSVTTGEATVARQQGASQPQVRDVELQQGGTLEGQVLDSQGVPLAETTVFVVRDGQAVAATQTGASGWFSIADLRGGVYQVGTSQGGGVFRLWAPHTAPPAAAQQVLVVHGAVARGGFRHGLVGGGHGQFGGVFMNLLHNPWFVGGVIATAIALPIALDDDDPAS